jgi:predicted glycoside hydrolase/deacetylase ChbG (UPF0249 family)
MRQKGATPSREPAGSPQLLIAADDYGYRPSYNTGILEAARAGAIDAASAMVERQFCDPEPLLETGVEVGLHLELTATAAGSRAGPAEREAAIEALHIQLAAFENAFGRPPAYLDGHNHCHAADGLGAALARVAAERGMPARSINERHRSLLRCIGVPTPDRLVGRLEPSEPALPELLASVVDGSAPPPRGLTEWMVHPGYRDPQGGSSYDEAREVDLGLVLDVAGELGRLFTRRTHRQALTLDPRS